MASDLKPVIQWTLDIEEVAMVSAMMAVANYSWHGNLEETTIAIQALQHAINTMGIEKANALHLRFERLVRISMGDRFAIYDPLADKRCSHCACDDVKCCICGKYKDLY